MEVKVPSLLRIKPKALARIGKYLAGAGWRRVALVWGEGLAQRFGSTVDVSLAAAGVNALVAETATTVEAQHIFQACLRWAPVDAVVAIGGGRALDWGKFAAHLLSRPLMVVPTVISNDGFGGPSASLTVDGRRRSFAVQVPDMVILDTEILREAPESLFFSGIGDLFCKATAVWDWKYAFRTRGEPVNDFAAVIALNAVDTFEHFVPKDRDDLEYLRVLSSSLLMCGLSMAIAGSSRPASGSEHLISHAYDGLAERPAGHGIQVGVASLLVAHLQKTTLDKVRRCALESGFWDYVSRNPLERQAFLQAIRTARSIKADYPTILDEPGAVDELVHLAQSLPEFQAVLIERGS